MKVSVVGAENMVIKAPWIASITFIEVRESRVCFGRMLKVAIEAMTDVATVDAIVNFVAKGNFFVLQTHINNGATALAIKNRFDTDPMKITRNRVIRMLSLFGF